MGQVRSANELPAPPRLKLRRIEANSTQNSTDANLVEKFGDTSQRKPKRQRSGYTRYQASGRLRRIIEAHRDMSKSQANTDKHSYLGALKYLPHAIYKVLENMPAPWEATKQVEVLYHISGAITFIENIPKVDPKVYMAQWGQMWTRMREEKRDRAGFRRMRVPVFDDEEPFMSFPDIEKLVPEVPEAIPVDTVTSTFDAIQMSRPFILDRDPPSMFDFSAFEASQEIQEQITNGPLYKRQIDTDEKEVLNLMGPNSYDDPQRIIHRNRQTPVRVEAKVAYPRLYGSSVYVLGGEKAEPAFLYPVDSKIKRHDHKKALFFDQSVNRVLDNERSSSTSTSTSTSNEILPFLGDQEIDQEILARSIACYESSFPYLKAASPQRRRPQDIALLKQLYTSRRPLRSMPRKTRNSYQHLLKRTVRRQILSHKTRRLNGTRIPPLLKSLGATKFFERTKIEWLEAAMQLVHQGYQILQLLIHRRGLHFLHLDYNFNLKPTKTLTTKERKRSRFGHSFHLVREMLKIVKLVVDCHIQFRLGNVDTYELNDGIQYIFNHLGQLTGLYRYKYKVMHQIIATNDLKHLIYDRFNSEGIGKGPGCGIWHPSWVVWLAFLRGNIPMLERWLGNLIQRQFFGRVSKGISKTVTKQRIDSAYDLELRAAVLHDILDVIPEQLRKSKTKVVMQHLSEAWRCWKANVPWSVSGMPEPVKVVIEKYIQSRADHWIQVTKINRERIRHGKVADKAVARKNMGRMTRIWLRNEQNRQQDYAQKGPYLEVDNAIIMYKTMASFLRASNFVTSIEFPKNDYPHDTKLLTLALENLKDEFNMASRLTNTQREQLAEIEKAYDNPHDMLQQIKKNLRTQRIFKDIEVSLLDFFSHLTPVYRVLNMPERITDYYLDQYLWLEAEKRQLFPEWVKPSDADVPPIMARKFCASLNEDSQLWSTENDATSAIIHLKLKNFVECVDLTLLNQLLKLIMQEDLADYITAKMNACLVFKDMSHVNCFGILRGLPFSSFVVQYYLMLVDVLILGLPRAIELRNDQLSPDERISNHPVRAYLRYLDDVYVVFHLAREDADDIIKSNLNPEDTGPPVKRCWSHDNMMRLIRRDLDLGKSLFRELKDRLPEELGDMMCLDASVYSIDNPALLFDIAGFEIRLIPKIRLQAEISNIKIGESFVNDDAVWSFISSSTGEKSGFAFLKVSKDSIMKFNNRVRQILMSSGSTTFAKIAKRWNTTLTATATYFREAAIATPELLESFVKGEIRVQNKIKMGLNSKMPARFPPCVFYSPEEIGGLGMLSASHILVPEQDLSGSFKKFKSMVGKPGDPAIPNLFRYINSWEAETIDSRIVWQEYAQKRATFAQEGQRILAEDLEEIWDRGLPRVATLFQKDRAILAYDKGFRCRQEFKNFGSGIYDPFWWSNSRHDGRLWNFSNYRKDVIQSLGGIDTILQHTLFKATGFEDWEGLMWQKQSGFEQQMQMQKLTNAQRSGLSQIPNRRFTLWWSPTINRGNIYIGFMVQLDLTGIFLHGKIPTLKISYIQIFRAHLWQKIHESLVISMSTILDNEQSILGIDSISKLPIHPRKSYRMNASTADILLTSTNTSTGWPVSNPSHLSAEKDDFGLQTTKQFWIDIQLRFGDFDSSNVSKYTKSKFLDFTNDGISSYPCKNGLLVCFDLAYNSFDAYGCWIPGLKQLIRQALNKLLKTNPALFILRERIRKALQLHQSQPQQPHITAASFTDVIDARNLILDDSAVYRVSTYKTKNGNMSSKPINGALFGFRPADGNLTMNIIHADSTWAGQKKLAAVSKWRTAELLADHLRGISKQERPENIIINTRGLRDPLEVHMLEFEGISVKFSDMSFPFGALISISRFGEMVENANSSSLIESINLYDDWLDVSQPTTAFSRLLLILRALFFKLEKTEALLKSYPYDPAFVWPRLKREEWIVAENELSDIVIDGYCEKNDIDARSLTQAEKRNIILGQKLASISEERQREVIHDSNSIGKSSLIATETHNVHGDRISVMASSRYEQTMFNSRNDWRSRAIEAERTLNHRAANLALNSEFSESINAQLVRDSSPTVLPAYLVRKFIMICDIRDLVVGLLYGNGDVVEAIALIPQIGSATIVTLAHSPTLADLPDSGKSQFMGIIRSAPKPREDNTISPVDLALLATMSLSDNEDLLVVNINFVSSSSTELVAFKATPEGLVWGKANKDYLSANPKGYNPSFGTMRSIQLSEHGGFFYVPEDGVWNYSFLSALWNANKLGALMKIDLPVSYFDLIHRPIHVNPQSRETTNILDLDCENDFN